MPFAVVVVCSSASLPAAACCCLPASRLLHACCSTCSRTHALANSPTSLTQSRNHSPTREAAHPPANVHSRTHPARPARTARSRQLLDCREASSLFCPYPSFIFSQIWCSSAPFRKRKKQHCQLAALGFTPSSLAAWTRHHDANNLRQPCTCRSALLSAACCAG